MELFYSDNIDGNTCILGEEESAHCVKVLRHRTGDSIHVIDGKGTMYTCSITECSPKEVRADIISCTVGWGGHPYRLHLAVCPTKNADRYEWFAEKACEVGTDIITPVIGDHSERRIFKTSRVSRILLSAAKQSLKGAVPEIHEPCTVKDFIMEYGTADGISDGQTLRLIAYCFEDDSHPRISVKEALGDFQGKDIIVMIGPEGDFSREEADLAVSRGFIPVHLGPSRLRTETAAVTAAEAVYFRYM